MSAVVAAWNELAATWLQWLLERSMAAAVTMLVVGLVLVVMRRRLSAHAPSHLLLLPAFVLLLPVERALPTDWPEPLSVVAAPPREAMDLAAAQPDIARPPAAPGASGAAPDVHASTGAGAPHFQLVVTPSFAAACCLMWSLVLLAGTSWLLVAQVRSDRFLRRHGRRPGKVLQDLFDRLQSDRGFDSRITLRVVPGLASPIATGVFRRAVCLPPALDADLSTTQLRFVLLHELEHHARRDVLVEGLLRAVRFAFWFHPVAWIVLAAHRRWREYACDEAAVARAGSVKRAPVADALFTLIHLANDAPRPSGAIASFAPSNQVMKNRLERILDRTRCPRRSLSAGSLVVLAATGLCALTVARAQESTTAVKVKLQRPAGTVVTPPTKPDGEVAIAIDQGISWLLKSQQADGSWDIGPDPMHRMPRDHNRVHVSGLALRALLPGWQGPRQLEIRRAVERAADYLRSTQNDEGLFGGGEPLAETYGHAQVLRALCAVQSLAPDDERLKCIARGVAYAEQIRNPYSGWRYRPRDGDNDSKHTALMLLALHDAAALGIDVPQRAIDGARELLMQLTDPDTGRTGFVSRGSPMSRFVSKVDRFPTRFSEEPTAMRLMVEVAFDDDRVAPDVLARAADVVRDMPPRWDPEAGTTDYAYWCFGAQAMAAVGGQHAEVWRTSLHATLLGSRIVADGTAYWPADDAWSREGMEAYSTASAILALNALH